ncbi:MAG: DUF192 domain-containing protein [Candidatus Moraniibacteriota bacterium]
MNISRTSIRRTFFIACSIAGLLAIVVQSRIADTYDPTGTVFPTHAFVRGHLWRLEIANTDALRTLGLGERDSLADETGMLFLFDRPDYYGFWMHGMRFPLDMVFLSRGQIVFIERGIQPGDPKIVMPPTPVDQVLELNAGEAAGLEVGDHIWYGRAF